MAVYDLKLSSLVTLLFGLYIVWFGWMLNVPIISYGHVGKVSSPKLTFSWSSLNSRLTSASCI